jgi:hypothetical protein
MKLAASSNNVGIIVHDGAGSLSVHFLRHPSPKHSHLTGNT